MLTGQEKSVYVGLSGGVDSSVAAALLLQRGYNVVGVYMQNWTQPVAGRVCPWQQDLADAKAVAARLGIGLKVFDFQKEYKSQVVDYMVLEYQAGRTPNPDVMCNQEIKFKLFLQTCLAAGADLIATGHYAQVKDGQLFRAVDDNKDQTYFLYRVSQAALERTLMPIGALSKTAVRSLAKELNLVTADKPDSQGICFVGEVGMKEFLGHYLKTRPGPLIRSTDGAVIGQHDGAVFYTIGQRQGLGVGGGTPYYVVGKDMALNTVFVTEDPTDPAITSKQFDISDTYWINQRPIEGKTYQVRIRHRGQLVNCSLLANDGGIYRVKSEQFVRALAPGQSAVLYDQDLVLGGGIINNVISEATKNRSKKTKSLSN